MVEFGQQVHVTPQTFVRQHQGKAGQYLIVIVQKEQRRKIEEVHRRRVMRHLRQKHPEIKKRRQTDIDQRRQPGPVEGVAPDSFLGLKPGHLRQPEKEQSVNHAGQNEAQTQPLGPNVGLTLYADNQRQGQPPEQCR